MVIFEAKHLQSGYDGTPVLHDVNFSVQEGQIVAILGSNGAGKTTTLRTVTGVVCATGGSVIYRDKDITKVPTYEMVKLGISHVPEGRHLFGQMSIKDNLLMGAYSENNKAVIEERMEKTFEIFPRLKERLSQYAGTLSGGEQQMVAIARGMMADPKLLMLDEPSLGLMPKLVEEVFAFIKKINELGTTVIIVEQNASETLAISDYAYVISEGETVLQGTPKELLANDEVQKIYLGL